MSDLARRRDARELWVSRSHLHAAVVASILVSVISFGFGYLLGHSRAGVVSAPPERSLLAEVPGEGLVALLAEVERGAVGSASSAIVYPELIDEQEPMQIPTEAEEVPGVRAELAPGRLEEVPVPDPTPDGAYTIDVGDFDDLAVATDLRDHLRAQGVEAWWGLERVAGVARYHVAVGGFEDEAAASEQLAGVAAMLRTSPVTPGAPRVVPLGGALPAE
jgi:hypothetical protein